MDEKKPEISCREAGRRGGKTTAARHGREHFCQMGEKGGKTTSERHGPAHYEAIGHAGGTETARRHGSEFYGKIGKKGGQRLKEIVARAKSMDAEATEG